jgi:hypothetical protein
VVDRGLARSAFRVLPITKVRDGIPDTAIRDDDGAVVDPGRSGYAGNAIYFCNTDDLGY